MSNTVTIGQRIPTRTIWASIIIAAVLIAIFGTMTLMGNHPEQAPLLLLFLLVPAIVIPAVIAFNSYAILDTTVWTISINGAPPRPVAHLTHCTVREFRGVCTLALGFSDKRSDRVTVSSHTPFGSARVDRDWVRYLLPYTGLRRDPSSSLSVFGSTAYDKHATLEQAQEFAHKWLK